MAADTTKELTILLVRRTTNSRLTVIVTADGKQDPRRVALEVQKQRYPDWMVTEVAVGRSKK